ncbi:hypothetical protein [Streptomyces hydrogenans]
MAGGFRGGADARGGPAQRAEAGAGDGAAYYAPRTRIGYGYPDGELLF